MHFDTERLEIVATRRSGKNTFRVFIKYCGFSMILKYNPVSGLCRCQCVYTMAGQTPALQQNLKSSENHNIFRKNTIFNEHPVLVCKFKLNLSEQSFLSVEDYIHTYICTYVAKVNRLYVLFV